MENLSYILYCLAAIGWSLILKFFFPKMRNGFTLFSAFGFMAIFMYIFGLLFGLFNIATYIIVYAGIASIIVSIILNIKYKHFKYKSLLSFSSILFIMGAIYLYFALRDYQIYSHDSYSHWGTIVRELYYSKKAFPNIGSISTHNDYPMIFSMVQYSMVSLLGYKESLLYLSFSLYKLVIIVGILDALPKQTFLGTSFFALLILITYPISDTGLAIDTLVTGTFLATLPIYFLLLWFTRPKKLSLEHVIPIFVCLALLPSAKIMSGFAFSIICVIIIALSTIKSYKAKIVGRKKYLKILIISFAIIMISHCSFYIYYNINDHKAQSQYQKEYAALSGQSITETEKYSFKFKDMFLPDNSRTASATDAIDTTSDFKVDIVKSAIKEFLFSKFHYAEFDNFSYPWLILLSFALSVIAYALAGKSIRQRYNKIFIAFCVIALTYALGLIYTYIFQMKRVLELHRYLSVLYVMYSISIAFLIGEVLSNIKAEQKVKLITAVMMFAIIIVFIFNHKIFVKSYTKDSENYRTVEENYTRQMVSQFKDKFENNDRVLIIDCDYSDYNLSSIIKHSYIYEMIPYYSFAMLLDDEARYGDYTGNELNNFVLSNLFNKIIILNPDYDFNSRFGSQFESTENMDIFNVIYNNGELQYNKEAIR